MSRGSLFIVSGPSGTGKGTVCSELIKCENIFLSISATTRNMRVGEKEGVTYFYTTEEKFKKMISDGQMLEYASYNGNYYGTPKKAVEDMLEAGKNVILEIEVQGALKVKEKMPEAILIFVVPPSIAELKKRLIYRGREDRDEIKRRIGEASREFSQLPKYNYVVVNDELQRCVNEVLDIINATNEKQRIIERLLNELKESVNYDD
ncbi:MAG: guanylate kinase [Clostridiales bacterium]|nr:guanylate kinase [Clostridiales bacterium]